MATPSPEKGEQPNKHLLPRKRLQLSLNTAENGLYFALAEAINRNMTNKDLQKFAADATADYKETLLHQGRHHPTDIRMYQAAGADAVDRWEKDGKKKKEAFDELAAKLRASVEQVERWKTIPESARDSKWLAEEMVFACVEELGRTAKRLREREQT